MKRPLLLLAVSFLALSAFSQQYTGYGYDNYAGTQSLLFNPANIAGSKYKVDINLFSVSVLGGNNAYELDRNKLFHFDFSDLREGTHYFKSANTDNKKLWLNTDIMGPSFMMTLNKKSGLGLTTRLRSIANEYNLSNNTFWFFNSDDGLFDTDISEKDVQLKMHAFAEAGLTYGLIISQTDYSTLKIGITGKYVHGIGVASMYSKNALINMNAAKDFNTLTGDFTVQYSSNIDDLEDGNFSNMFDGSAGKGGWGVDAGLVWEWRPGGKKDSNARKTWLDYDQTPYKLRMSVAVTDFGYVNYKNSPHGNSYLLDASGFNADEFKKADAEDYDAYFDRLEIDGVLDPQAWKENLNVKLPMAIRADVDYHIYKRLFINAGAVVNMVSKTKNPLSAHYTTSFTVTPRLEKKWFGIYVPVYYNMEDQFSWGAGFRLGPIFAGSSSVISNLISKDRISAMDVYVGMHIPIFQPSKNEKKKKKKKAEEEELKQANANDRDKDGVTDDKDECPDVAGEIALIGCPDSDGDGVADKNDKCPDVKGSVNFNGCPAPDSDGDGLNDDEDKCPNLRGSLETGGCPEVNPEVVNVVNTAARRIYFITRSSTILKVSYEQLDVIANTLMADPNLHLTIEGHTDNVGKAYKNDILSQKRANSVKAYLIKKGIPPSRMTTKAYGESRPAATNKYVGGRAKNRRVELKLTYAEK
jgi:outer membrane protein OmpA-like peptidoglycan-associated protein